MHVRGKGTKQCPGGSSGLLRHKVLVGGVTQSQLTHALQARSGGPPGPADDSGLDWGVSSSSDIIMCTVLYTAVGGRSWILVNHTDMHTCKRGRGLVGSKQNSLQSRTDGDEVELHVLGCRLTY